MPKSVYTWDDVKKIVERPHLLGYMAGMKDLQDIHSDWIKYIHDAEDDVALMASRSSYKSSSVVIIGMIYRLMRNPNGTNAIVRKSYTLAADVVKAIMGHMESPAIYELLRHVYFADANNNIPPGKKWKFTTRKDGRLDLSVRTIHTPDANVAALGLDSNMTGQHYDFAILDDTVTVKDRMYQSEREYTKFMTSEIRANIVKKTGYTALSGTRWHGRDCWEDIIKEGVPLQIYPYQMLPFISPDEVEKARRILTGPLFSCNYELRYDNDEDMIFHDPYMGPWEKVKVKNIQAHIDAAYGGIDTVALTIGGELGNGKLNMVGFVWHKHVKEIIPQIMSKLVQYGAKTIHAEDNSDRGFVLDLIAQHPYAESSGIFTRPYTESMNKQIKISTALHEKWQNIQWANETDEEYLLQICDWNENTKSADDAPDSAASLVREAGWSLGVSYDSLYEW